MKDIQININDKLAFQFISVKDYGSTSCPHCGAEGRYIYTWAEHGIIKSAMAGCYKALTGKLEKGDIENHIERIAIKQAKGKELNGWDKTILRMIEYKQKNSEDSGKILWANNKIEEAVRECKKYISKF